MEELRALLGLALAYGSAATLLFGSWPGFPEWSAFYFPVVWLLAACGIVSFPRYLERLLTASWLAGDIWLLVKGASVGDHELLLIPSALLTMWLLGHRYRTLERRWKPPEWD